MRRHLTYLLSLVKPYKTKFSLNKIAKKKKNVE